MCSDVVVFGSENENSLKYNEIMKCTEKTWRTLSPGPKYLQLWKRDVCNFHKTWLEIRSSRELPTYFKKETPTISHLKININIYYVHMFVYFNRNLNCTQSRSQKDFYIKWTHCAEAR